MWGAASMRRLLIRAGKCSCSYTTSAPVMTSGDCGRRPASSPHAYGTTYASALELWLPQKLIASQEPCVRLHGITLLPGF